MSKQEYLLKPGQLLRNGELEIIEHLGSGGFGEVYRATWRRKEGYQQAVVKCFNADAMSQTDLSAIQMVHKESLLIGALHHASTVQVYGVDLEGTIPYLFEEYLVGKDLSHAIQKRKTNAQDPTQPIYLPIELTRIGIQIATALDLVHAKGIYHGDLKPSNICFRDSEQTDLVLVDFGHGGFYEGNSIERKLMGSTLGYLSPERTGFVKLAGNASCDLYSVGVTLYEACTGKPLFEASNERDFINLLLREVPKPLTSIFQDFPEALADIIQKLLRKNPEDRYHSAFGLLADLERCFLSLKQNEAIQSFALGTKDKLRELNYKIPIVGRQQELTKLFQGLEQTLHGNGTAFMISAPSGSGKSRLAHELVQKARKSDCHITATKFSEFESNLPLSAISLLLMEHADSLREAPASKQAAWRKNLQNRLGSRGRLISKRFGFYEGLLPDFPALMTLDKEEESRIFDETLAEFLVHLALPEEGHIIFLDDLQWADWQSIAIVHQLCQLSRRGLAGKSLLIGTFRSNEVDSQHPLSQLVLSQLDPAQNLELGPLSRTESDDLVHYLLDESSEQVEKLQAVTYQLTNGSPFFVYEYLKSAISSGIFAMREDSRQWIFDEGKAHNLGMSHGVAGLVAERILQLPLFTRAMIITASVAGNSISLEALKFLMQDFCQEQGIENAEIAQQVQLAHDDLIQKHLVLLHDKRLVFFHDKIKETAYQQLTAEKRSHLHSVYGFWLACQLLQKQEEKSSNELFETALHIMAGKPEREAALSRQILFLAANEAVKIFAYAKARDFLQNASLLFPDGFAQDPELLREWIKVHELWANTVAVSDQIYVALELYDRVLEHVKDPVKRAELYAKKTEFNLTLFQYKNSMQAGVAGLECLNERIMTQDWQAIFYLLLVGPWLIVYSIWFYFFGKQTCEISNDRERIRLHLLLKLEVPFYFTKPLVAIANLARTTFEILRYKDNDYRALVLCYWGAALGPFGFDRIANRCLTYAYDYFDRQADPVQKGFVLVVWGYLVDFMVGDYKNCHYKIKEALKNLTPVGESFWRSISQLSLLHIDYYGGESGDANLASTELYELWKRVRYNPTILACSMRNYLHEQRQDQIDLIRGLSREAEIELRSQGYDALDVVYACLSPGEIHFLRGEYETAEPFIQEAFWIVLKRSHRVAYALYAPVIYAWCLARQRKFLRCFTVLGICWLNQLLHARIFLPQTLFATGEAISGIGFKRLGSYLVEKGIQIAYRRSSYSIVAEGRIALGHLQAKDRPEQAEAYFHMAREYYKKRPWPFFEEQCDRLIAGCRIREKEVANTQQHMAIAQTHVTRPVTSQMRQRIEMNAMLEIFLKLSALSESKKLLEALLDSLCASTGAEIGLVLLPDSDGWQLTLTKGLALDEVLRSGYSRFGLDKSFLDFCIQSKSPKPEIRPAHFQRNVSLSQGSVLVVPLAFDGSIYGYCYLYNAHIHDLFDDRSVITVSPIATQAAITLQSIQLTEQLKIEHSKVIELNRTLEGRVEEQTRDIRSIMEHIPLGVFAIQGSNFTIHKDYSQYLEHIFDSQELSGRELLPLLFADSLLSGDDKQQVGAALDTMIGESSINYPVNEHILPKAISKVKADQPRQEFELSWNPIIDDEDRIGKILVTLNDVTEIRKLQTDAKQKTEELQLISEILAVKPKNFANFMQSSFDLAEQNRRLIVGYADGQNSMESLKIIFMNLHTIKGSGRTLGLRKLAEAFHIIEQAFVHITEGKVGTENVNAMREALLQGDQTLNEYQRTAREKLGRSNAEGNRLTLAASQAMPAFDSLKNFLNKASPDACAMLAPVYQLLQSNLFSPMRELMQDIFSSTLSIAKDLGKPLPSFAIELPHLAIDTRLEEMMHHIFMHLIRNAMDHGIESSVERERQGKPAAGMLRLHGEVLPQFLRMRLEDDGRGLDISQLKALAMSKGYLAEGAEVKKEDIARVIFEAGISTAKSVTEISGRGIGMAAIQKYLKDIGGYISLDFNSQDLKLDGFAGFAFNIDLPLTIFACDRAEPLNQDQSIPLKVS